MIISFTKASWLGNMSPYPVTYQGKVYRTAEALFQALRFSDVSIAEEIRNNKSPMGAKFVAKRHAARMTVTPCSEQDVRNMDTVLRLKLEQHPDLLARLQATGNDLIVEDVTKRAHGRNLFWGAALKDGVWVGDNVLGKLWMKLRQRRFRRRKSMPNQP